MNHKSTWISHEEALSAIRSGRGRGIRIAILDSGVDLSHPQLRGLRLADDIAFLEQEDHLSTWSWGGSNDVYGHGTAVASIIREVAPEAAIGSFRVLNSALECSPDLLRAAAMRAIVLGYDIINCSLGIAARPQYLEAFKQWLDAAYVNLVHVVSACNNMNFRVPEWPGAFPSVLTVNMAKATDQNLYYRWENARPHLVEFAAAGVDLPLAWSNGESIVKSGSSFAAPRVTGILARMLSEHPGLKPLVAKSLLQEISIKWSPDVKAPNG